MTNLSLRRENTHTSRYPKSLTTKLCHQTTHFQTITKQKKLKSGTSKDDRSMYIVQ